MNLQPPSLPGLPEAQTEYHIVYLVFELGCSVFSVPCSVFSEAKMKDERSGMRDEVLAAERIDRGRCGTGGSPLCPCRGHVSGWSLVPHPPCLICAGTITLESPGALRPVCRFPTLEVHHERNCLGNGTDVDDFSATFNGSSVTALQGAFLHARPRKRGRRGRSHFRRTKIGTVPGPGPAAAGGRAAFGGHRPLPAAQRAGRPGPLDAGQPGGADLAGAGVSPRKRPPGGRRPADRPRAGGDAGPLAGLAADDAQLLPRPRLLPALHYAGRRGGLLRRAAAQAVPARESGEPRFRSAATVAGCRTAACSLFAWLGIRYEIARRKKLKRRRLPPIVPKVDELAERWRQILASPAVSMAHRRQVVLTQALILLWGTRLKESLTALADDVEGHWVLVAGKTGVRISYLNSQALGLVQALRGQMAFPFAAERHSRVSGWPWGLNKWHAFVRECATGCGIDCGSKPQQDLRKRFSSWVKPRDPDVEKLLGGHGGDVIFDHYLDTLERVPPVMEQFFLPAIEGFVWPQPVYAHRPAGVEPGAWGGEQEASAAAALTPPRRLYARFDAWLEEQERRAAS